MRIAIGMILFMLVLQLITIDDLRTTVQEIQTEQCQ